MEKQMTLEEIAHAVTNNSVQITNTIFITGIFETLCDDLELKNQRGKDFRWNKKTVSAIVRSNKIPPSILEAFKLSDFSDMLLASIREFSENYKERIGDENCAAALSSLFEKEKDKFPPICNSEKIDDLVESSLFNCLYQLFWQLSKKQKKTSLSVKPTNSSLFATIISSVVKVSNQKASKSKHPLPYSLDDKMALNKLGEALKRKLSVSFDSYFDAIEDAFDTLSDYDYLIKSKFLETVHYYYLDYLEGKNLSPNSVSEVSSNASDIFTYISSTIMRNIELNSMNCCYEEQLPIYVWALVTYAFYRCRILIPMEGEKYGH